MLTAIIHILKSDSKFTLYMYNPHKSPGRLTMQAALLLLQKRKPGFRRYDLEHKAYWQKWTSNPLPLLRATQEPGNYWLRETITYDLKSQHRRTHNMGILIHSNLSTVAWRIFVLLFFVFLKGAYKTPTTTSCTEKGKKLRVDFRKQRLTSSHVYNFHTNRVF